MNKELLKIKEEARKSVGGTVVQYNINEGLDLVAETVKELTDGKFCLDVSDIYTIRGIIMKFGIRITMESVYTAFNQYYTGEAETFDYTISKIGGIAYNKKYDKGFGDFNRYTVAICKNKFEGFDRSLLTKYLNDYVNSEDDCTFTRNLALCSNTWNEFSHRLTEHFNTSIAPLYVVLAKV